MAKPWDELKISEWMLSSFSDIKWAAGGGEMDVDEIDESIFNPEGNGAFGERGLEVMTKDKT